MSNVVRFLPASLPAAPGRGRLAALVHSIATSRRPEGDAYWMKENIELLSALAASGRSPEPEALAPYRPFYDALPHRLAFFPQFYRLLLGMAVWLEAGGMDGDASARMARYITQNRLPETEVNDLQRAETRVLLARARAGGLDDDPDLTGRLIRFMSRPAFFALPNQRAAYDLTHAVFYLADYGARRADLPPDALKSLENLGTQALLAEDSDLLAEVCLALHYAGARAPAGWLEWLGRARLAMRVGPGDGTETSDGYHNWLVNQWLSATIGGTAFDDIYRPGPMRFTVFQPAASALSEMSQTLLHMQDRRADWSLMRGRVLAALSHAARQTLMLAESTSPDFPAFFRAFARAGQV